MDRLYDLWESAKVEYDNRVFKAGDPRLKDWPMVQSPVPTMTLIFVYFLMCYLGPKIMATRKALELRSVMVVYNLMMVGISLYLFLELLICGLQLGYNFICDPLEYRTDSVHMRMATALWVYYFSKMIEFAETAFFILRKKSNQITFLHVYHHATMFALWWIGIKWYATGTGFFSPMINGFVHVVIYSYYGLSVFPSLRRYLWWKKYLTILQLVQFSIVILISAYNVSTGCSYDSKASWAMMIYLSSLFILFMNFFLKAYTQNRIDGAGKAGPSSERSNRNRNDRSMSTITPSSNKANVILRQRHSTVS